MCMGKKKEYCRQIRDAIESTADSVGRAGTLGAAMRRAFTVVDTAGETV